LVAKGAQEDLQKSGQKSGLKSDEKDISAWCFGTFGTFGGSGGVKPYR
jgi:hypothetical protein